MDRKMEGLQLKEALATKSWSQQTSQAGTQTWNPVLLLELFMKTLVKNSKWYNYKK